MENNNKPFFDPYILNNNFNSTSSGSQSNAMPKMPNLPGIEEIPDINSGITSATKYYEQQYMYYKYLTQVLDYKTRLFEYEKLTHTVQKPNMQQK